MFHRTIIESARYLKMPSSSQSLYFHLCMNADDDGVVEGYTVLNKIRAHEDDLKVLITKGFVILLNEDLVSYIVDWLVHNTIRADRKIDSIYQSLLLSVLPEVKLIESKPRSDVKKSTKSVDSPRTAESSIVENSLDKNSIDKCSVDSNIRFSLKDESITDQQYTQLLNKYDKEILDSCIKRIIDKPYYNCLNEVTISNWCEESQNNKKVKTISSFEQRTDYDFDLITKKLINIG